MYYATKTEARAFADTIQDARVATVMVQFEPSNGYVVVIIPKYIDLTEYGDRAEVRTETGVRLTPRPKNHKKAMVTPQAAPRVGAPRVAPAYERVNVITPVAGGVKLPWER